MPNTNQTGQALSDKFAGLVEKAKVYAQHILSLTNDSFEKTVVVALALCLVGAVLVSGSAVVKSLNSFRIWISCGFGSVPCAGLASPWPIPRDSVPTPGSPWPPRWR